MGQMYPRKPFAGFARPLDPDSLLRAVRAPSIPPATDTAAAPSDRSSAIANDSARDASDTASTLSGLGDDLGAFAERFTTSLKENTLTTLGTTLAMGIAFGAIFGSKIGRIAVLIAAGALLHNFAIPAAVKSTKDAARRSGV